MRVYNFSSSTYSANNSRSKIKSQNYRSKVKRNSIGLVENIFSLEDNLVFQVIILLIIFSAAFFVFQNILSSSVNTKAAENKNIEETSLLTNFEKIQLGQTNQNTSQLKEIN